jgi:hypothetical protein
LRSALPEVASGRDVDSSSRLKMYDSPTLVLDCREHDFYERRGEVLVTTLRLLISISVFMLILSVEKK